ncbi:MAG: tRNA dihydrouridine synthase DusB [Candidatus Firestonebacteria bacterium RIFOXYA2_FULL_40_8]|nr:MAG: tRNA dihydrouridine synthase DusB [Candidatus Firestonebacteria bacterium RIFOXYA2_FULL_40_8]
MQTKSVKIGKVTTKNNIFLAPMAGITDIPFRAIVKAMGAGLLYSEMISAEGLIRDGKNTKMIADIDEKERPVVLQIFGGKPSSLGKAAYMLSPKADIIDINCGCSVRKVMRSDSGAALLKDSVKFKEIVSTVVKNSLVPVTVKIRSGWDNANLNAPEIAKIAEDCGVSAVTIHPRTRCQGFGGKADWNMIGKVKNAVKIPVIGSGDIHNAQDAGRMLEETGCDAVMIGRSCLGDPWIFRETLAYLENGKTPIPPSEAERLQIVKEHGDHMAAYKGERTGIREFRKHLLWYFKGMKGIKHLRPLANKMETLQDFHEILKQIDRGMYARV